MLDLSRRQFIGGLSALCAAGAVPGMAFSAARKTTQAASAESAAAVSALEKEAAGFSNPLRLPGTKVLMKSGRAIREAVDAIAQAGLLDRAALVADCGLPTEQVCEDLRQLPEQLSYFATILVR